MEKQLFNELGYERGDFQVAKIIGTEKSPYYNKNIEIFSQNKVGQYAKYLQRNPIFVEYYQINQARSRADSGTGSINTPIGPDSPLRYNKIKEFPIYNVPEMKPDVQYDETGGMNIDMDLNGIVILPGTIQPIPGDFIYLKMPGMKQGFLIEINNFEFNTIQSNDFYLVDTHIMFVEENGSFPRYDDLQNQVVESYTCIFDNIGTQDKCIIRDDIYEKANEYKEFIRSFSDNYREIYYQGEVGAFACFGFWTTTPTYLYDLYLTKFIKETDLFFDDTGHHSTALSYDDSIPMNFDYTYRQTLWYAVQHQTSKMMQRYQYYRTGSIMKSGSPFKYSINAQETQSIRLELSKCPIEEYLSQRVGGVTPEYFPILLTKGILEKNLESTDYLDLIIYNWVLQIDMDIDFNKLMDYDMTMSRHNFWYFPLIIFILQQKYNAFFATAA